MLARNLREKCDRCDRRAAIAIMDGDTVIAQLCEYHLLERAIQNGNQAEINHYKDACYWANIDYSDLLEEDAGSE